MTAALPAGVPPTIRDALERAAAGERGITILQESGAPDERLSYRALRDAARRQAAAVRRLAPGRLGRIGLIANTGTAYMTAFLACQYAGVLAANLPMPFTALARASYPDQLARLIAESRLEALLGPRDMAPQLAAAAAACGVPFLAYDALEGAGGGSDLAPLTAEEPAYIQYSSGTTSAQKGFVISQRAIGHNVSRIVQDTLGLTPDDRALSWLPLYHDMGFVGMFMGLLYAGIDSDYIPPRAFIRNPLAWLRHLSERRSSVTYVPPFCLDLCVKHLLHRGQGQRFDLSALKILGLGAEMIQPATLERFHAATKDFGLAYSAFTPSYGMAEATLAISAARGVTLARANDDDTLRVGCGRPLPGSEVTVLAPDGSLRAAGEVGEIHVRTPSLFTGYAASGLAPPLTAEGRFATGDLGFLLDGALFVTGRAKELVIVNGRKIWLHELESTAQDSIGAAHGDVVALREAGEASEQVTLLIAQRRTAPEQQDELTARVRRDLLRRHGIHCKVRLVEPKAVARTSSGKLVR